MDGIELNDTQMMAQRAMEMMNGLAVVFFLLACALVMLAPVILAVYAEAIWTSRQGTYVVVVGYALYAAIFSGWYVLVKQ